MIAFACESEGMVSCLISGERPFFFSLRGYF